MSPKLRATSAYLVYSAGEGVFFRFLTTIYSVFAILELGLDPLQLVLMGTILEGSYLLFEVPTGVIADTFGRKASIVVGLVGTGAAFLLLAIADSFAVAMLSQALWGIFATFQSGADVAWLTDEIGEERAREYYVRGDQVWHVAALAGIAAGVGLGSVDLRLPILVCGAGYLFLGVFLALRMPEERFRRRERALGERVHQGLTRTLREGVAQVRAHHVLLLIIVVAALHGASTEGYDRLSDLHVLCDVGLPGIGTPCEGGEFKVGFDLVVWFGVLDGVALVIGYAGLHLIRRRMHLTGHAHVASVLGVIDTMLIAAVVVFGLSHAFWLAVATFWAAGALRSIREPLFTAWVNQGLESGTRATINSLATQADAIGQTAGGPVLGIIARRVSVPSSLVTSGLLRAPALLLYLVAIRRGSVGTAEPDRMEEEISLDEG
jgi:DHA3 family tetracycline resistance protein-like MFS transporter